MLLPRLDQVWKVLDMFDAALILRRLGARALALALKDPAWTLPRLSILKQLSPGAAAYVRELIGGIEDPGGAAYTAQEHILRIIRSLAGTTNEFLGRTTPMPKV